MSIEVTMNLDAIGKLIQKSKVDLNITASDVLRFEMGSIASALTKYTPPSTRFSKQPGTDKTIGTNAVKRDFHKIFSQVKEQSFKKMEKRMVSFPQMQITNQIARMKQWHKSKRNSRGGVSFKHRALGKAGKIEITDQMYVTKSNFKSLLEETQSHVGKLKAGWNAMLKTFRAKSAPDWVSRHSGSGYAIDKLSKNKFMGYIGGVNSTPYASIINKKGIIGFVLDMHRDLVNNKLKSIVSNAARRFNATNPTTMKKVA